MNDIELTQTEQFALDSNIIGEQTEEYLRVVYPSYLVNRSNISSLIDKESTLRLQSMTFFRIDRCTADNVDKVFENINERFEKLFTALYSIDIPIAYGIISRDGITNLVIGVYQSEDVESVKAITQGMLSGIELSMITTDFTPKKSGKLSYGILSGVPSLFVKEKKQVFSLSAIMRSLNGQDYTLLFIAKPVKHDVISQNISELISIRDKAFAVSKRNIARSNSYSESKTKTLTKTDTLNSTSGSVLGGLGSAAGAIIGTIIAPGVGTHLGTMIGGSLGTTIGNIVDMGESRSKSFSKSISKTISNGETVSADIQNGFALELINYADNAIERLKGGQNNGIWQTAITYSAQTDIARNIIRACLSGELSKLDAEKLPMLAFEPKSSAGEVLQIPAFLDNIQQNNPLCSYINSAELGLLCTVPTESVPDFELRLEKKLPLIASRSKGDEIEIGNVAEGKRALDNMPFAISEHDLNKHTFVCGITGSGKTTTVKKILIEAKKPFLVIESAKKEYRNIALKTVVYTLGRPEINAPQMNPFYIMPGINPQVHIDFLKDLFNASFSFYGPMPYILEKCIHSVYQNKGWDLTLGYHPMLSKINSPTDLFDIEHAKKQYDKLSHKYLFPTMQDLKDEIARYIEKELKYDGEVAGNVKTAMKVRLENLCVGTKGYTFNTSDYLDFSELLKNNVVFELEGLADDSDKAFSVGLLIIFINEYRQVQKEISGYQEKSLEHLLVIEEAHRLLKNVDTERTTETSGNPKGKAVEHFTNMLAEMRSYGQGVIVAEQIPTKLAPDVIKNSSTKIVQRIVSADDQQTIANTIGLSNDSAIQLGALETGYAYCHKEGMAVPTPVKILNEFTSDDGKKKSLDIFVSDEELYYNNKDKFNQINLNSVRNSLRGVNTKQKLIAFINTIMVESDDLCVRSCQKLMEYAAQEIKYNGINWNLNNNSAQIKAKYLTEGVLSLMVNRGIYQAKALPENDFAALLEKTFYAPTNDKIKEIKAKLQTLYEKNLSNYACLNVVSLVRRQLNKDTNNSKTISDNLISNTIRGYFIDISDETISQIENKVKGV